MQIPFTRIVLLALVVLTMACGGSTKREGPRSENGFYHMEVTVPAGECGSVTQFLPYPGNYGFVPGTTIPSPDGKQTKQVPVMLLSAHAIKGDIVEFRPVGLIKISGDAAWRDVVIGVPLDTSLQIIHEVRTFFDLQVKCISCVRILYEWMLNYERDTELPFRGWGTELEGEQFILDYM